MGLLRGGQKVYVNEWIYAELDSNISYVVLYMIKFGL